MKRDYVISVVVVLGLCTVALAEVDHNPKNAGNTLGRNIWGTALDGSYYNPALLGVSRSPFGGLNLFPLTNIGAGYWSDKLAIGVSDLISLASNQSNENLSSICTRVLRRSSKLYDASRDSAEASKKLTEKFKNGFSIYGGVRTSLISFAHRYIAFDITTHLDEELRIPEGPLYIIFSSDKGLLEGNALDFSNFRQQGYWATDFTLSLGLPVTIPKLHELFRLKYGAGGVAVKYIMGHSMLKMNMKKGSLVYKGANQNELAIDAEAYIVTSGAGFRGDFKNEGLSGFPINGHGIGADIGGILYDKHAALTINFKNLGVLLWTNDVRECTKKIKKDDLDFYDVVKAAENEKDEDSIVLKLFNRNLNEYMSDSRDTLVERSSYAMATPMSMNIGYSYTVDFDEYRSLKAKFLQADYATLAANYEQTLIRWPGRSFWPRLSLGGELGALYGYLPLRVGFVFGGHEKVASAIAMGINFDYFSIHGSYKAIGTPVFWATHGTELAGGINVNWGMITDSDKDGIPDRDDACPKEPEDKDGFEDADGCPEIDNDLDGIPDLKDKCPNEPEDIDGFEDDDGCPDYDNDKDGIADSLDKCPDIAEDRDNFDDGDGCPDYDNDLDGIADSTDRCPNLAEDRDLFQDFDGCPDYDNDNDGIPDSTDRCPDVAEVYNGFEDNDGCPDSLMKPTKKEEEVLNKQLANINFKTASAELTDNSYTALNFVVNFLRRYPWLRYEIQGHTDSRGSDDYNLVLSAARAKAVADYLKSQGIPDSALIAIGYGETQPIASNNTAAGRAQNRRTAFKIIETKEDFERLLRLEQDFQQRLREAKIRGSGY